jgi:Ca2+-binding RTX toxin-like protein
MYEKLERRRLLAVDFVNGVVSIEGTNGADTVEIADGGPANDSITVFFNGTPSEFVRSEVVRIDASMLAGPDLVIIGSLDIPTILRGGKGDDSLSGGDGVDLLYGEGGFDYLFGRESGDTLIGGLQNDLMAGGTGDDVIVPFSVGTGDDTISGGAGLDTVDYSDDDRVVSVSIELTPDENTIDDRIYPDIERLIGGRQNDQLFNGARYGVRFEGGPGNDLIVGGSGNDTLDGQEGDDTLRGFGGDDVFFVAGNGADLVFGGSGTDRLADAPDPTDTINEVP